MPEIGSSDTDNTAIRQVGKSFYNQSGASHLTQPILEKKTILIFDNCNRFQGALTLPGNNMALSNIYLT